MTANPAHAASDDAGIVVLDTNVCLDLFVFDDPRCAALHAALEAGELRAVTDEACSIEWQRVLHYPVLRLDDAAREAARRRHEAIVQAWPSGDAGEPAAHPLRCRDPHDQKFLDLAARAGARWLLSRDDHLLSLARRARRAGLFAILTPEAWLAARAASA